MGFPGDSVVKSQSANPANAGDEGLIPGLERFSGEEIGNPVQYSFLGNPMHRACHATVHEVAKESDTT